MAEHAVQAIRALLGAAQVADDPQLLRSACRNQGLESGKCPELIAYPRDRADVQALVRLARESHVPLVPVSSGAPHFSGGSSPSAGGVIVDFTRMRRIIRVDARARIVRVEPGVTFGQLVPVLAEAGLRLNLPLAPRANKSALTSALEREVSLIPKYDFDTLDPLTTLEVVYGTGDDFRTGSAAGPGRVDETLSADLVSPWGPANIDYYRFVSAAQGTLGLVTWAVLRTELKPQIRNLHFVALPDSASACAPVDALLRQRVVDECLIVDGWTLADLLADCPADVCALRGSLPAFTLIVAVAGYTRRPEERVSLYEGILGEICAQAGLRAQRQVPGAAGLERAAQRVIGGVWSREPHWRSRGGSGALEIFFLCPLSQFPRYVRQMQALVAASVLPGLPYGTYVQPAIQGRAAQVYFNLPYEADNRVAVEALFRQASQALLEQGAFFSRPYGAWAGPVFGRYPEGVEMLRRLKRIFDPDGILNPGKLCFSP